MDSSDRDEQLIGQDKDGCRGCSFSEFLEGVSSKAKVSEIITCKVLEMIGEEMKNYEGDVGTRIDLSASIATSVLYSFLESLSDFGMSYEAKNSIINSLIKLLMEIRKANQQCIDNNV